MRKPIPTSSIALQLFDAITYDKLDVAKQLLESGVSANTMDEYQQNPLFRIVYNKKIVQIPFLELFTHYGANVNFRKPDGSTPVFFAKGEILHILIANKAEITIKNNKGDTPLHYVSNKDDAHTLITLGLNINERNNNLSTTLHNSVYDTYQLVQFLIESGADVNAKDINGRTPLINLALTDFVIEKNELEDVISKAELLLAAGADVNIQDITDRCAADYAIVTKNQLFASWLRNKGMKNSNID